MVGAYNWVEGAGDYRILSTDCTTFYLEWKKVPRGGTEYFLAAIQEKLADVTEHPPDGISVKVIRGQRGVAMLMQNPSPAIVLQILQQQQAIAVAEGIPERCQQDISMVVQMLLYHMESLTQRKGDGILQLVH